MNLKKLNVEDFSKKHLLEIKTLNEIELQRVYNYKIFAIV